MLGPRQTFVGYFFHMCIFKLLRTCPSTAEWRRGPGPAQLRWPSAPATLRALCHAHLLFGCLLKKSHRYSPTQSLWLPSAPLPAKPRVTIQILAPSPCSTEPQESPKSHHPSFGPLSKGPQIGHWRPPQLPTRSGHIFSNQANGSCSLSKRTHFWNAQTPNQHDGSCRHPCGKIWPRPAAGPPCAVLIAGPWGPVGAGAREQRDSCGRHHTMLQACAPVSRAHRWPHTLPCRSKPPRPAFSL